jgi:hypothetical protein
MCAGFMELQCIMHSSPAYIDDHVIWLISIPLICHAIILVCASIPCLDCCYSFPVCFFAVEHESEIEWTIPRTNTCPSTYDSRRRIPKIYFYSWLSTSKASIWSYVFKVFQFLLCRIRFKCLLSVVRVILSYACSCRLNSLIHYS